MKNRKLITRLTKGLYVFGIIFLLTGMLLSAVQTQVSAQPGNPGGGGSIWTTKGDCGSESQDVNHFSAGDVVYINGSNFWHDWNYPWSITGTPGSGDPNQTVASGWKQTDNTGSFCFAAYTVKNDDDGEYKVNFSNKNDNYRVDAGVSSLSLDKTARTSSFNSKNDVILYDYVVTNTGTVTLSNISVSDDKTSVTCPDTSAGLAANASITCTASYSVTQDDLDAGFVTNEAHAQSGTVVSNSDIETVNGNQNPSLGLAKSANPLIYGLEGEVIGYSYVVTNTGNVTLSAPFNVDDDVIGGFTCSGAPDTLAPGASFTCSAGYSVTLDDLDSGSVTNTATVSTNFNGTVTSNSSQATITASQNPALQIVKSSTETVFTAPGQTINYSYELTNIGNVTLNGFTVIDDKIGTISNCDQTSLAPNDSTTCSGSYTTTQDDMDAGEVTNSAYGTGSFKGESISSSPDNLTIPAQGVGAQLGLVKIVEPSTYNAVDQVLSYTYTLTNTGDVTMTGFSINDDKLGTISNCDKSTLAPTESTTCTASWTVTQADLDNGSITNVAVGYGYFNSVEFTSNQDSATANAVGAPGLALEKSVSPDTFSQVGDVLSYSYILTNSGAVTLSGPFTVSDDKATVTCPADTVLGVGTSITCTASYTVTLDDLVAGSVTNTAKAYASYNSISVESNEDTATATAVADPKITLEKSVTETSYDEVGDILHYTYTITNSGNVALTGLSVTDNKISDPIACLATSLAIGESTTCTAEYSVTQSDLDDGAVINTAQGHASYNSAAVDSNTDDATVYADQKPSLHLDKTADEDYFDEVGDVLHYNYKVTNTGNVTLYDEFIVHDDRIGKVCSASITELAPGDSFSCQGTFTIRQYDLNWGAVGNTAQASASTDPVLCCETRVYSNVAELVIYGLKPNADLTLEKTVNPETYDAVGQTLTYTYKLINTGSTSLFGPFSVIDDKLSSVDCSGAAASLEPTESTTCTASYTITQDDIEVGEIINTAQAFGWDYFDAKVSSNFDDAIATADQKPELTLDKSVAPDTFGAVGDTLSYSYVLTNSGNVILSSPFTVDDDKTTVTCPATDTLAPGESITCTASYTITQADMDEMVVVNQAKGHCYYDDAVVDSNEDYATATGDITGPALQLVKSVTESSYSLIGDVLHYTYTLTNIGDVTLYGPFSVFDDKSTDETCELDSATDTLAPDATTTCTATYTVTEADLISGSVTNIAYAEGFFKGLPVLSNNDDETVEASLLIPTVTIDNIQQGTCVEPSGEACLDFTITVSNLSFGYIEFFANLPSNIAEGETTIFTTDGTYTVTVCDTWPGITDRGTYTELAMSVFANWVSGASLPVDPNPVAEATGTISYDPENRLVCFPQDPPVFGSPYCDKVNGNWRMAVNLKNPNDMEMDVTYTVDGGSPKSATIPAYSSIRISNLSLGKKHTIAVYWGNDGIVELRPSMSSSKCYNPPEAPTITAYSIPVTAVEAPAPVTEAVVLIPVTGADLGNIVESSFIKKLMLYMGLSFLGMAFITHSLRNKFIK